MKFKTLGNPANPAALLIHAMFVSETMFHSIASILQDNYYVILPTLDGHDLSEDSTFISAQDEACKIADYLQKEQQTNIEILLGTSLGGIIAFELFRQSKITIHHIFLDGAPFIRLSDFRINIMAKVFKKIAHSSARHPEKANILDKLYPQKAAEMKKICGHMSDESVKHLTQTCYTYELPPAIKLDLGQSVTFIYGTAEKARVCIPTVKKFTNCRLIIKENCGHCEFLAKNPRQYVEMLESVQPQHS